MTMIRRGIAALPLVALVAILALPGCEGDSTKPTEQTLGDLSLTLELARSTVAVSDTVTAAVFVHNADTEVLDDLTYAWRWSGRSQYGAAVTGMTRALVQPAAPGRLDVEVIVSDGTDTKILSAWIMVAPAAVDGSRSMITVFEGAFLRGERPDQTAFDSNTPQRSITLSRFSLARTEMTNATCAEILNWMNQGDLVSPVAHPGLLTWSPGPPPWDLVILDFSKTRLVWSDERISVPAGYELHPVTGVTWPGAAVLCTYLSLMDGLDPCYTFTPTESIHLYDITCDFFANGYRLPTEAGWEKAARGG
jgi:formylglycine-generating enzyme required for sulfatase activity